MERVRETEKKTTASEKLWRKAEEAHRRFPGDPKDELLPGIPNEIATDLIAAKLPWRTMYELSLVSTDWARVIRSRKVYDARVRSGSTETLLWVTNTPNTIPHSYACARVMGLVSTTDKSSCNLPEIPYRKRRTLLGSKKISVNGNLYHLGGYDPDNDMTSDKVYVMDLVGQKQWRELASMIHRRCWFGCHVIDGKIFVFGGVEHGFEVTSEAQGRAEVYDPTSNIWSLVEDMPWSRTKDRFMIEEPVRHTTFKMQESFYKIDGYAIHVYDAERKSWSSLHKVSYFGIPCNRPDLFHVVNAVAVGDRLLALVHRESSNSCQLGIFEGYGVDSEKKEHIKMLRVKDWRCYFYCKYFQIHCDPEAMVTVSI